MKPARYGAGDSAGVSSVPAGDSVVTAGASVAAGLVISVVADGGVVGVGVGAGATVSVFCSHAARSAAPARMQIYFFICGDAYWFNRLIAASAVFGPDNYVLLQGKCLAVKAKAAAPILSYAPPPPPDK